MYSESVEASRRQTRWRCEKCRFRGACLFGYFSHSIAWRCTSTKWGMRKIGWKKMMIRALVGSYHQAEASNVLGRHELLSGQGNERHSAVFLLLSCIHSFRSPDVSSFSVQLWTSTIFVPIINRYDSCEDDRFSNGYKLRQQWWRWLRNNVAIRLRSWQRCSTLMSGASRLGLPSGWS